MGQAIGRAGWVGAGLAALCLAAPAAAAETRPGTVVINIAELRAEQDGQLATTRSNEVRLIVAERLDVVLAPLPAVGGPGRPFTLANGGSGDEAFVLTTDRADVRIAIDVDGDGRFDPAVDRLLVEGRTPSLAPAETLQLLALDADDAGLTISAHAATGSGAPGTAVGSVDGVDAVTGRTGAAATLVLAPLAGEAPTLTKAQAVVAPDGTARAVAGSIVTYTLTARFGAAAGGAVIEDPLPATTAFVPGSLTLDGQPLSDAEDADAGESLGALIRVRLGDAAPAAVHTVTFAVRLP